MIALAVIAGASAIALAAVPGGLNPMPPVIVVFAMPNGTGSGTGTLFNDSVTMTANVTSIDADVSCPSGITVAGTPTPMFTVGPKVSANIEASCPATSTSGIRRCLHHVNNGPLTISNVTVLCVTSTGTSLTYAGGTSHALPDAIVNGVGATDTLMIEDTSGTGFAGVSIQLADQDDNFRIGPPCNSSGCDVTIAVLPGGSFGVPVMCTPKSLGPQSTFLYVVAGNGASLPPVMLTCNGLANTGMDPMLEVDATSVTLLRPVNASGSATFQISNIGPAALAISSIEVTGTDWSATVDAPCNVLSSGCALVNTAPVVATVTFSPTALGPRNGSFVINSNDPETPSFEVLLLGIGQGGVLVLDNVPGAPPLLDLGGVPIGFSTSGTFRLRNDGDLALDPVNLTTSGVFTLPGTNPTTIGASSSEELTVSCTPLAEQVYNSQITVTSDDAFIGSPLQFAVRCQGTTASFYSMPGSVMFDEIRVNTAAVRRTVTLWSVGPTLDISSGPALATTVPGMSVTPATPTTFSMTQPATFEIVVAPTADGDLANTVSVATTTGGSIDIPVTGKVVTPDVDVPAAIMAGSFCVGQSTMATTANLDANGTASIALPTRPVMAGGAASPFQVSYTSPVSYPYQLPAGAKAAVEVTPLRQAMPGTRTDALVWATDSPNETAPQTMITATFIADGGAVAPQTVDFGSWPVRATADARSIRIQNCGTEPIALLGLTITPPDEFRDQSAEPLPAMLQPNQIATLTVGFTPRRIGSRMGTVTIDSSKGPLLATLLGTGLGDPGSNGEPMSFYACDCSTSDPAAAWPALLVILVLRRRRRA